MNKNLQIIGGIAVLIIAFSVFYYLVIIPSKERKQPTIQPTIQLIEDLDQIERNYKVDSKELNDNFSQTFSLIENTPYPPCQNIIEKRTERANLYYYFLDGLKNITEEYGKYRYKIEYIGNNLNSLEAGKNIMIDKCESVGFTIPTQ